MSAEQDEYGFTLMEMLVVIGILSIIASMIVPSLGRSLDRTETRRYARSLQSALRSAQTKAFTMNHCVRAKFSIEAGTSFRLEKYSKRTCEAENGSWERVSGLSSFQFPGDVEIYSAGQDSADSPDDSGEACLLFSPDAGVNHVYPCDDSDPKGPKSRGHPYIHLGPAGLDFSNPDACWYFTVFTIKGSSAPQPQVLPFGAYDEFSYTRGDDPC